MKEKSGDHDTRGVAVNGHELSEEFTSSYQPGVAAGPDIKETVDREATRYLSAATQIDLEYASSVVDRVVNERLKALAPTFGINVPVVVRWAIKSLRTRSLRDKYLAVILVMQCLFLAVVILWWTWAWTVILLLLASAWLVTSWDHYERIHNTVVRKMLWDRFNPEDAPLPHDEADQTRLREVTERRDGNLVVFSGHSAFIGSGDLMYNQRILLDVSGRRDEETDKRPGEFTSHDLHVAIVEAFGRANGLGKSLENIRVYERLFVNGLHVQNDRKLLPNSFQPPPTSVDDSLLRAATVNPSPEGRTYVCVEMPGWQGQLVVNLFIRAVYAGKSLFVEWTFRVLPPIRAEFLSIDKYYQYPRYVQFTDSLVSGLRALVPALVGSPVHTFKTWNRPRVIKRQQSNNKYAINRGSVFDYGARQSIREDASGSQRRHYFLARDENMYVLLAQQTLTRTVGDFLEEHGVDLGHFKDQVKVIFDQSINYSIGDITGSSGIVVGDNSSARVGESPKGKHE